MSLCRNDGSPFERLRRAEQELDGILEAEQVDSGPAPHTPPTSGLTPVLMLPLLGGFLRVGELGRFVAASHAARRLPGVLGNYALVVICRRSYFQARMPLEFQAGSRIAGNHAEKARDLGLSDNDVDMQSLASGDEVPLVELPDDDADRSDTEEESFDDVDDVDDVDVLDVRKVHRLLQAEIRQAGVVRCPSSLAGDLEVTWSEEAQCWTCSPRPTLQIQYSAAECSWDGAPGMSTALFLLLVLASVYRSISDDQDKRSRADWLAQKKEQLAKARSAEDGVRVNYRLNGGRVFRRFPSLRDAEAHLTRVSETSPLAALHDRTTASRTSAISGVKWNRSRSGWVVQLTEPKTKQRRFFGIFSEQADAERVAEAAHAEFEKQRQKLRKNRKNPKKRGQQQNVKRRKARLRIDRIAHRQTTRRYPGACVAPCSHLDRSNSASADNPTLFRASEMLPVLLLWLGVQEALAGKGLDTCTGCSACREPVLLECSAVLRARAWAGVVEEDWFHACDHMTELSVWVAEWSSSGAARVPTVCMKSPGNEACRSELERRGLPCGVYDIALNPAHDLLGRTGFKDALQLGLRIAKWQLRQMTTYMGAFGHVLTAETLSRNWTPALRQLVQRRRQKKYPGKVFIVRDGSRWRGTANLTETAVYTRRFVRAVAHAWLFSQST
ncbi:hypothetical protein AK812_SmicGene25537 [Symbiodinium microadriaticum]|uniref:Uncharacterized protein n=1 Tax=Symbiodinium microadriaticum TaxID=2951 RepID=A0A1Q9DBR5_SYMMI|nr:hypothetical protein AK812_SmicGene25537 [Symbiodinium microadriaticum]